MPLLRLKKPNKKHQVTLFCICISSECEAGKSSKKRVSPFRQKLGHNSPITKFPIGCVALL